MEEIAKVVKIEEGYAIIKLDKKKECDKCGMCLFPKNVKSIEMKASNSIRAKVGDNVLISMGEMSKTLAIILIFLVPLILIGISAVLSFIVIKKEIWMLILTGVFLVIWFMVLSLIDKKIKNKDQFIPKIISIISSQENIKED